MGKFKTSQLPALFKVEISKEDLANELLKAVEFNFNWYMHRTKIMN